MINELIKLATHLDAKGLSKEADYLDAVIKKLSSETNKFPPLRVEQIQRHKEKIARLKKAVQATKQKGLEGLLEADPLYHEYYTEPPSRYSLDEDHGRILWDLERILGNTMSALECLENPECPRDDLEDDWEFKRTLL